jgi:dihydrofolate synthase/folylpolyglutamate synthase
VLDVNAAYTAAVDWLFDTQQRGVKLGLNNALRLLSSLGEPQKGLQFIHVAGTNGKGSVCAMIDSISRAAGMKTGLFTSPHLVRFNERIKVDGIPIGDEAVVRGIHHIQSLIDEEHHPTFFEITTALAFDYFRANDVDLVVLETGLGGRLDATNVVNPLVSVLTSIDLDHQKWLGHTLTEISMEKAGIIKPGVPIVSGPQLPEVRSVLEQVAGRRSASLSYAELPIEHQFIGLAGSYQRLNAAIAVQALRKAGLKVNKKSIKEGLANVSWPGRFQLIGDRVILDGAHNPAASRCLVETWIECMGQRKATIIFGGLREKDLQRMVSTLSTIAARFLTVQIRSPRAASPAEIQSFVPKYLSTALCDSATQALDLAYHFSDPILIAGSLFLVGEFLAMLQPSQGVLQASNQ